jgi:hypothetical protein
VENVWVYVCERYWAIILCCHNVLVRFGIVIGEWLLLMFLGSLDTRSNIRTLQKYSKRITETKKTARNDLLAKPKYTSSHEVGSSHKGQLL